MSRYTISVGDWGGDGHGEHEDFIVEIPDAFNPQQLGQNYLRNVRQWGFGPSDFVCEYESSWIEYDKLRVLLSKGFVPEEGYEDWQDEDEDDACLTVNDMLEIVMIYFGYGLPEFTYSLVVTARPEPLIGYWSSVTAKPGETYGDTVGYGLFS